MNQSLILKLSAVVAALFGLALALAPNQLAAVYKAPEMNPTGIYNSMLYGAFLIGLAVMNWAASNASSPEAARYVVLGNLVGSGLALIVAVVRQLGPTAEPLAWVNVAIFLVFSVLFGYLYFSGTSLQRVLRAGAR